MIVDYKRCVEKTPMDPSDLPRVHYIVHRGAGGVDQQQPVEEINRKAQPWFNEFKGRRLRRLLLRKTV